MQTPPLLIIGHTIAKNIFYLFHFYFFGTVTLSPSGDGDRVTPVKESESGPVIRAQYDMGSLGALESRASIDVILFAGPAFDSGDRHMPVSLIPSNPVRGDAVMDRPQVRQL